jgi:hypothetical protein
MAHAGDVSRFNVVCLGVQDVFGLERRQTRVLAALDTGKSDRIAAVVRRWS